MFFFFSYVAKSGRKKLGIASRDLGSFLSLEVRRRAAEPAANGLPDVTSREKLPHGSQTLDRTILAQDNNANANFTLPRNQTILTLGTLEFAWTFQTT